MSPSIRVGLHLPQLGRSASLDHIVSVARGAESRGFADVWTADHIAVPTDLAGMPSFFPEPVPLLAAVAAHTERVGLGTSVMIPAYRNPMHLAKQWATLDWLAPGRTILGVGAGWLRTEFEAVGVPMERRGKRLDDYIRGWRAAWSGATSYESDHWSFEGVKVNPIPSEPIRVWIGGTSPGALRRAAWCDGWQGTWAPLEVFRTRRDQLVDAVAAADRNPDEVTVSIHCEFRVGDPPSRASRWSEVGDGYGDRAILSVSPSELVEILAGYVEEGLDHVILVPIAATEAEWHEHVDAADHVRRALTAG